MSVFHKVVYNGLLVVVGLLSATSAVVSVHVMPTYAYYLSDWLEMCLSWINREPYQWQSVLDRISW